MKKIEIEWALKLLIVSQNKLNKTYLAYHNSTNMADDEGDEQQLMADRRINDAGTDSESTSFQSGKATIPYKAPFVWVLCFVGSIGGFLFGYDTGIIAGA